MGEGTWGRDNSVRGHLAVGWFGYQQGGSIVGVEGTVIKDGMKTI